MLALKGQDMLLAFTEDTPILMLAQDHGIPIHINLQGILFRDVQCAPQLCGQDDSAKLVNFSNNTGRFHTNTPFSLLLPSHYVTTCP